MQSTIPDAATQGEDTGMNKTSAFKGVYNYMVEWTEFEEEEDGRKGEVVTVYCGILTRQHPK